MTDFFDLGSSSFWFYDGRQVRLKDSPAFGKVTQFKDLIRVGSESANGRRLNAFFHPGTPGFVVEGEPFELFATLASEICTRDYDEGYKFEYSFASMGLRSIDLMSTQFGAAAAIRTICLPENIVDQRERLIVVLNEAISVTRCKLQ